MNVDYVFKIVVLGDSGVGKTSFIHSLQNNDSCKKGSTIGVDFNVNILEINNKIIKTQIWDTAGQEQFRAITKSYFRNVAGALLFFDVSKRSSFYNLRKWIDDLVDNDVNMDSIIIVANKTDLSDFNIPKNYENIKVVSNSLKKYNSSKEVFSFFISNLLHLYETNKIHVGIQKNIQINKIQNPDERCNC